jgi:hypothetical protein
MNKQREDITVQLWFMRVTKSQIKSKLGAYRIKTAGLQAQCRNLYVHTEGPTFLEEHVTSIFRVED